MTFIGTELPRLALEPFLDDRTLMDVLLKPPHWLQRFLEANSENIGECSYIQDFRGSPGMTLSLAMDILGHDAKPLVDKELRTPRDAQVILRPVPIPRSPFESNPRETAALRSAAAILQTVANITVSFQRVLRNQT